MKGRPMWLQLPRRGARGLIAIYRYGISPLIGPKCRHLPTCSDYSSEAIGRFGLSSSRPTSSIMFRNQIEPGSIWARVG